MSDELMPKIFTDEEMFPFFEAAIWGLVENAVLYGDIDVSNHSDEEVVYGAIHLAQSSGESQDAGDSATARSADHPEHAAFEFGSRHDSTLFEEANSFLEKEKHELATLLYATWIEHWINRIILTRSIGQGTPHELATALVRSSSLNLKMGRIWSSLNIPQFDRELSRRMTRVMESRNAFVHFKWPTAPEDAHNDSIREAGDQAREAKATVEDLIGFEDRVFWDCRSKALKAFVRSSLKEKRKSWIQAWSENEN